jgi:hypothetical protein
MTTYAPDHDTVRDAHIREAWTAYRDQLAELDGAEYESAEQGSWDELQDRLRAIADAHAAATGGDPEA